MKNILAAGLVAASALCLASGATGARPTKAPMSKADAHFLMEAAQGGMAEVRMGQLASEKGTASQVKQFGLKMVEDHGMANRELAGLAKEKGWTLPVDVGPKHKKMMSSLAALSGPAFDKAYVHHMVMDHKEDIAGFEKEARSGKDPDLKAWAAKTLPTLRTHLEMVTRINAEVK